MTIAGVHRPLAHDLYVLLVPWQTAEAARSALQERATFKVYLNPLVGLVWWGRFAAGRRYINQRLGRSSAS